MYELIRSSGVLIQRFKAVGGVEGSKSENAIHILNTWGGGHFHLGP